MLTICGAAIGSTRKVEVKEGWVEQANLYTAVVADAGTGKSPALAKAFNPVLRRQMRLKEKYDMEMKGFDEASENDPPSIEEVYVTSTTTEALTRVFSKNKRGVILKADELSGWVNALGQYKAGGKGDDLEYFLSLWSGSDIKVNRASQPEPTMIEAPFCSITGNITPNTISSFHDKEENGFIHRILISYPEVSREPALWTDEGVPKWVAEDYARVIENLYSLEKDYQLPTP